jgi:hypothetical protein
MMAPVTYLRLMPLVDALTGRFACRRGNVGATCVLKSRGASPADCDDRGANGQSGHHQGFDNPEIQGIARDEQRGDRRGEDGEKAK